MIAEIDLWRTAKLLLKQHGEDAALIAAQRADEMLAGGDVVGLRVWLNIVEAIRELQPIRQDDGEQVN